MSEENSVNVSKLQELLQEPSILLIKLASKDCDFIDGNAWCEDLDLRILLPYPMELDQGKKYIMEVLNGIECRPFDNRADFQDKANILDEYLQSKLNEFTKTYPASMAFETHDNGPHLRGSLCLVKRPYINDDFDKKVVVRDFK